MSIHKRNRGMWLTKDGRKIPVKNLTSSHLQNIIKKYKEKQLTVPFDIQEEAKRRRLNDQIANTEVEKEIVSLREEIEMLKKRIEDLEKWKEI